MVLFALIVIGVAALFWSRGFIGHADTAAGRKEANSSATADQSGKSSGASVDLSEKQASALKIGPLGSRDFTLFKTAVGTIDFNEDLLVQVFSQYPGKILKANFNIGDDVKAGDVLFTIDSPDLLQAESTLLAAAGVLELQKRTLARATQLLKAGGSAQKDVDQSTSDEQTAEGNFKAARDAVRIFGKTDAEIDQIVDKRKVDSVLLVPSPISGRVVARSAAPGFLTQPGNAPAPYAVADLSTMWMIANVIETDAPAYKLGQERRGKGTGISGHRLQRARDDVGIDHRPQHPSAIGPLANRRSQASAAVGNVRKLCHSCRRPDAVRLRCRRTGVVREGDGTMTVWVTSDSRRFIKRTVKVGLQQDGWTQILEGLQPGETVVTDGAVFLSNKLLLGDAG